MAYTLTKEHLAYLRSLGSGLMFWLFNRMGYTLNGAHWDPEIVDRTLEWSEALGALKKMDPSVITSTFTEQEYMMEGYNEYLRNKAMPA